MRSSAMCSWRRRQLHIAERSEEHTSELQSHSDLVCRLLLEKKNVPTSSECAPARTPLRLPSACLHFPRPITRPPPAARPLLFFFLSNAAHRAPYPSPPPPALAS